MRTSAARQRVAIEAVRPEIDCGRFPIKRAIGEPVDVEADAFADGHDLVACALRYRGPGDDDWTEARMASLGNDRWRASFTVTRTGSWRYTVRAWIDRFATWRADLEKRRDAGQDLSVELLVGAELVEDATRRARGDARRELKQYAARLRADGSVGSVGAAAFDDNLAALMANARDPKLVTEYVRALDIVVDRERARFGAWYEFFPRSCATARPRDTAAPSATARPREAAAPRDAAASTLREAAAHLDYVARLGFDVVYLPPIHPIGLTDRKGAGNSERARPGEPGSPWAIGSSDGGHDAIHPDLGTLEDFDAFVARARELNLEVALDLALQCSPDHPYVTKHPEWFRHLPDGSIRFAENPPKKYQDIYPIDFETASWRELWDELRGVVEHWIEHGVRIFRVDNPHTKPFAFWEWLIGDVKAKHPDVLFLSEAFTRPKVMRRLAKAGFTQSYSYFTWRVSAWELREYFTELTQTDAAEYMRANLWPNTPDILPEHLQNGGRSVFVQRLVLAATLGANYGIYGPAFELMESAPVAPGREEYAHSEKYEIKQWDLERADSLADFVALVNRIRHEHPALQTDRTLRFHDADNGALLVYTKTSLDGEETVLVVVNCDPQFTQGGWVRIPVADLLSEPDAPYVAHDLLTGARYTWKGDWNYVELNPNVVPAHVLRLEQHPERDLRLDA
jgi:starch synthase (maltosyl-transferring)